MQIIDIGNLAVDRVFPEPLFHISGRKLLAAHTKLNQAHLDALVRSGVRQVYKSRHAREVLEFAKTPVTLIPIGSLVVGVTAETDYLTPEGTVIIQQNEQVEEHHVSSLRDSGIDFVISRAPMDVEMIRAALDNLSGVVVERMKSVIGRGEYMRTPESRSAFIQSIEVPPGNEPLDMEMIQLFRRRMCGKLQPLYGHLETGKNPSFQALAEITDDLLELMRSEPRQFSQLALMSPAREDYLPDHALSVAVLSMAIAAHMGLTLEMVREVIGGALLCDVGMLALPKRIRVSSGKLTESDRSRVEQHPVYTLSMLEQVPGLSPIARLMGYQHHERMNGEGYPNRTAGAEISDFARIVSVADILAAAANPRCYKSAKLPYNAMEELVHLARAGVIDSQALKALLKAIGLFPVGSYVLLSNQMTAQVIGANADKVDRPLVRIVGAGSSGGVVDLSSSQYAHMKIGRAIAAPGAAAELAAAS